MSNFTPKPEHIQTPIETIIKPWGKEIWFANQPGFVGKILCFHKGHRLSLQYHERKVETQYVIKGRVLFTLGYDENDLKEVELGVGEKFDVYPGMIHRVKGLEDDNQIFEVSTNDLDDVVKLADDYGRSGKGNNFEQDAKLAKEQA